MNSITSLILLAICSISFTAANPTGSRIVGGHEALLNQTRHQVSLRYSKLERIYGFGYGFQCGGSLIAPDVVLTAAHCVVDFETEKVMKPHELVLVMGSPFKYDEMPSTQVRNVKKVVIHNFSLNTIVNDVALLKLKEPFELDDFVHPISLAKEETKAGSNCMVSGWGDTKDSHNREANHLLAVNITMIDTKVCNAKNSYHNLIYPGMICAGTMEGGRGSCHGDSGGPLVCGNELVGVVSWGDGCDRKNKPGVYADVHYYYEWIQEEMKKLRN